MIENDALGYRASRRHEFPDGKTSARLGTGGTDRCHLPLSAPLLVLASPNATLLNIFFPSTST